MKNILSLGAAVGVALLALVGCGDDEVSPTDINTHFEPKQGDTFTYARYERDMNNQRRSDTKTIHKWVVLQTGLTYKSKTNVSKILQLNFDGTGTVSTGAPDTVYLRSAVDGEVFMDVIPTTLRRIPLAAPFADSIPFEWFKIGDTKISNTSSWQSIVGSGIIKDVQYPVPGFGDVTLRIQLTANASHKGKVSTTIGDSSYANAFHTDHTIKMDATLVALSSKIISDSLQVSYDIDVTHGLLRQAMKSDSVSATIPGQGTQTEAVAGFEMELISMKRK